jgi:hypothetical protein
MNNLQFAGQFGLSKYDEKASFKASWASVYFIIERR